MGRRYRPCRRPEDVASIEIEPDLAPPLCCCEHCAHFVLAYRIKAIEVDLAAIVAKLEELTDRGGVGLTPHAVAVDQALAAVAVVNETIDKMGSTGSCKTFNRAFKAARTVDPSIKYVDYLEARKAAVLETLRGR